MAALYDQTVQELTRKKRELIERREKLMRPIKELDKEIVALALSVAVLLRDENPTESEGFPLRKIRNMTQSQALFEIAKYNDGVIRSLEVKAILVAAKLMKNTKNASGMVNDLIKRTDAFERIGRGEYRLKNSRINAELEDFAKREGLPFNEKPVQ